jgi:hypothetical protein
MQVAGTPMFVVKAYLPVNESFGKHDAVTFIVKIWYSIICVWIASGNTVDLISDSIKYM